MKMPNKWLDFLKKWKATKGKGVSLKDCMKTAKGVYRKGKEKPAVRKKGVPG